jgi:phage tail sheath protein FI
MVASFRVHHLATDEQEGLTVPNPYFGFQFIRDPLEPVPPSNAIMSIVGMAGPFGKSDTIAQEIFDETFPIDEPVMFNSTDSVANMIDPESYIGDALQGINDQLGEMEFSARVIVVRTELGIDPDPQIAFWKTMFNICGSSVANTGVWAFKTAGAKVGAYPRLVCIPGYTSQRPSGVSAITMTNEGLGYGDDAGASVPTNPEIVLQPVLDDQGKMTDIAIIQAGYQLTGDPPAIVITGTCTTPATATCTIDDLANPVCAMLEDVLQSYLGHAVIDMPGTNEQDAIDARSTLQSSRLICVEPAVKLLGSDGFIHTKPMSPRIIGVAVARDFAFEGRPFRSWANQPIYGIVGPSRPIDFSLTDGAVEGQDLLMHQIGVLVQGESGDDFAIADGGFVFIGVDNVGEIAIWQQYHKVRGRDFIELTVLRTLRYYLGRYNLTTQTIQAVVSTIGNILNIAQAKGDILGYLVRFDPDQNNPDDLRQGKIYVDMRFEEAPVFRLATIMSRPDRPALDATIASLTASVVLTETASSAVSTSLPTA